MNISRIPLWAENCGYEKNSETAGWFDFDGAGLRHRYHRHTRFALYWCHHKSIRESGEISQGNVRLLQSGARDPWSGGERIPLANLTD